MRFRKRPIVIQAERWFRDAPPPAGVCQCAKVPGWPHIHTLEGSMEVTDGDWIITGVKGEHYPCKPDVFELTYECVEE